MTADHVSGVRRGAGFADIVLLAAITLTVIGMMLVVGGVLVAGLFMAGAVLIAIGMVSFALAGVLHVHDAGVVADGAAAGSAGTARRVTTRD